MVQREVRGFGELTSALVLVEENPHAPGEMNFRGRSRASIDDSCNAPSLERQIHRGLCNTACRGSREQRRLQKRKRRWKEKK